MSRPTAGTRSPRSGTATARPSASPTRHSTRWIRPTVYASAFDQGVWRRSPSLDGTCVAYGIRQVFAPQFAAGGGIDRTMFAPTVKNGQTRIYLTDGTANGGTQPSKFWRTDNAGQPAAALLASQAAGSTVPPANGNPFPANYNGWQKLTSSTTASPYYATYNFCTGQCWYDEDVYTPAGLAGYRLRHRLV